ncbi:MAG TPA: hypothetical protein VJX95_00305, partial [Oscillospiraceae bacterium]|nr:hypothetical protein [Oscillospiraceae bacterium]
HGVSYLISNRTFIGIYLVEVVSFSTFLYTSYKTVTLFTDKKKALLAIALLGIGILNAPAISLGDSAEELSLPLFAMGLYILLRYFKRGYPKAIPMGAATLAGVLAGCTMWIKYSLLGFWFGWMLMLFVAMLYRKHVKEAFGACFVFLGGMLLASVPWIIYFGVNNALYEMVDVYFLINAKYYPSEYSLGMRLPVAIWYFLKHSLINASFAIFTGVGIYQLMKGKMQIGRMGGLTILACMGFLALGVFGGGREYIYYYFIFAPFAVLGMPCICELKLIDRLREKVKIKSKWLKLAAMAASAFVLTLAVNVNTYTFFGTKRESMAQYSFAKVIEQTPNATLLNYGYLDYGFYTTTGIVPNVRYFENQNIPYEAYPYIMDGQNGYLREKAVDYVVIRIPYGEDAYKAADEVLYENYELIMRQKQRYRLNDYEFLLFQVRK